MARRRVGLTVRWKIVLFYKTLSPIKATALLPFPQKQKKSREREPLKILYLWATGLKFSSKHN